MGYTKKALKGISYVWALTIINRFISFVRTIFFARLLNPSQFGIYGIALIIIALLETLTETGINVFLVQRKENIEKYISTAWVVSIARGSLISVAIIASSSIIVNFFQASNSTNVILLFSIVPFIRGFINPSIVKFQKELRFNNELWFRFAILLVDTVISIALLNYYRSVSSIAIGLISGSLVEVFLSFIIVKPKPKIKIGKGYYSLIFNNNKWITLSGIFNYMYHNLDTIVVGRLLGTMNLGLYEMAYNISMLPITDVSDVVSRVTFPVYSLISGDKKRLRRAFIKSILLISFISILLGSVIYIFAEPLVTLFLGKNWLMIVGILRILVIFGVIRAISGSSSALFLAVGKQSYVTVVTLVSILALAVTIVPLTESLGLYGASISVLIGSLVALPFMFYYTLKIL